MKTRKKITYTRKQIVFARDRWTCVYCLKKPNHFIYEMRNFKPYLLPVDDSNRGFEIDHIIPYSISQDNSVNNLCTACWECNNKKSNKKYKIAKNFPVIKLNY